MLLFVYIYIQCFLKVAVRIQKVLEVVSTSVYTGLNPFNFIRKRFLQICICMGRGSIFLGPLYALLQARYLSLAPTCTLRSTVSEMSINFLSLSLDGLPHGSAFNTEPVSRNFSLSLRTALRWGTGVSGKFSANCSCTKSVCLLPYRKTYSTRKTRFSIERIIVTTELTFKNPASYI
jgi:hypothetical protein